ncbi:MAG TPA: insulinase family protein, partial [Nannocystis exedens]|nr:insulinase family protein [Nannocystis exedens]
LVAPGFATASAKASQDELSFELPIQSFTLANGLRVYVVEDHSTPAFNLTLHYDVGARDEEQGRTGFAHLFEHMMFEGSANVPPMGYLTYIQRVGGNNNAGTSWDSTIYYDNLPSQYLDLGLWMESDRLRSLEITDENFENQRKNVKEEKAMRMDNVPYAGAFMNFLSTAWAGSGYDHPPIGSIEDLNAATTADVKAFFDRYYTPNNVVVVLVGDVDFNTVKGKIEGYFGDIPRGPERAPSPPTKIDTSKPLNVVTPDPLAKQALYAIGWHTVGETHPDRYALDLLGNILLVGDSARIPKILTDEKKLVAFTGGSHFSLHETGLVFMQAMPLPSTKFDDIKQVVRDEVAKVQKRGITKKELQKAINTQLMGTVSTLATNQGRAGAIASGVINHNDPKYVLTELQKYQEVTPKDIKRVAKQYLGPNWLTLEIQPGS